VRRLPRALGALVAAAFVAATWTSPAAASGEADEPRGRLVELERHKRVSDVEIARLRQEIARLERELEAVRDDALRYRRQAEAVRREPVAPADVLTAGSIEEADVTDEELELEPLPSPSAPQPPVAESAPGSPVATLVPISAEARELYDGSYTLFHERRYEEAAASFTRFLERHPQTDLSDNAQFWTGESHYAQGDYDSALLAFMRTVERYPEGNKVADALVKAGKCLEHLGDPSGAMETYRELIRRFEGSVAAAVASERLAELGG
jgi:tol-pal system protein YbgF